MADLGAQIGMGDAFECLDPSIEMPHTVDLKKKLKLISQQFWSLAVQNQVVGGAGFSEVTAPVYRRQPSCCVLGLHI